MRLEFSIYRYNPDVDDAPRMQDYTLEAEEGRDMMLLDALIQLKEKDPSLSNSLRAASDSWNAACSRSLRSQIGRASCRERVLRLV